ncbi:hypothetical protein [Burkholderia gladioli]|uniref:phage tail fiber protein n=1 Tax=Burkholderia gladioli TaxID=28095 RepID=UPI00163F379D|nr:hypothetical protein [Burkholderia gladioli]
MADTNVLNPKLTSAGFALFPQPAQPGFKITITHVALGTSLYTPPVDADGYGTQVALVAEVARYPVTSGNNPTPRSVQVGTTITDKDMTGRIVTGKAIGEIGFFSGNTLVAVWSRPGVSPDNALFVKSKGLDVPFAYTLDVSILPANSVTVNVTTDPQGMAALILQHEAKPDPHPVYVLKARGMGEFDVLTTYMKGAKITGPDGNTYRSLADNNVGNSPALYPALWQRWGFSQTEFDTKAPLNAPKLVGPVSITGAADSTSAQLTLAPANGAAGLRSKLRFYGTFGSKAGTTDTNARLVASIAGGFRDTGLWGGEYLDFLLNNGSGNDAASDANQAQVMRLAAGGRVLINGLADDGVTQLQVGGGARIQGGVASSGLDAGGANFRLLAANGRDAMLRNDGTNVYLLLSDSSGIGATFNSFRPFTVNTASGVVTIDDGGVGTYFGGELYAKGGAGLEARIHVGKNDGYFYGNESGAGWYSPTIGAWQLAKGGMTVNGAGVWTGSNLPNPIQSTGFAMAGAAQILAAPGQVGAPSFSFTSEGGFDSGFFHIADGTFGVTNNGRETARFIAGNVNRILIGTQLDNGLDTLQVHAEGDGQGIYVGAGNNNASVGGGVSFGATNGSSPMAMIKGSLVYNGNGQDHGSLVFMTRPTNGTSNADLAQRMKIYDTGRVEVTGELAVGSTAYFGYGNAGYGWANSDSTTMYFYGNRDVSVGANSSSGKLNLVAGGAVAGTLVPGGRLTLGVSDDGNNRIQSYGGIRAIASVGALIAESAVPGGQTSIIMSRSGASKNQSTWEHLHDSNGSYSLRVVDDGYQSAMPAMTITRGSSSSASVALMQLMPAGGRVLIGWPQDDGQSCLQGIGGARFAGGIASSGLDAGGANFRLIASNGNDAFFRNDGSNAYLLLSSGSGIGATFNAFRPFTVNTTTGVPTLDATGTGTYFGGDIFCTSAGGAEGRIHLGTNDGYYYGNADGAGWWSPTIGSWQLAKSGMNINGKSVWTAGNLPNPAQTTGFSMAGQLLLAEGSATAPSLSFINDGTPDTGLFHINDGTFGVTNNGIETARFTSGNRVLLARTADDGASALQVGGPTSLRGQVTLTSGNAILFRSQNGAYSASLRSDDSGLVGFINQASNRFNMQLFDNGQLVLPYARPTWAGLVPWDNGNFDPNSKANASARVQIGSSVVSFGTIDRLGGSLPAPYVVVGLSAPGNATANAITVYGALLSNQ